MHSLTAIPLTYVLLICLWRFWRTYYGNSYWGAVEGFGARGVTALGVLMWLTVTSAVIAVVYGYSINPWTGSNGLIVLTALLPTLAILRGWQSPRWWVRDLASVFAVPAFLLLLITMAEFTIERFPVRLMLG